MTTTKPQRYEACISVNDDDPTEYRVDRLDSPTEATIIAWALDEDAADSIARALNRDHALDPMREALKAAELAIQSARYAPQNATGTHTLRLIRAALALAEEE